LNNKKRRQRVEQSPSPWKSSTAKAPFSQSFRIALSGIYYVLRTERNAQWELTVGILVLIAGILFGISTVEWTILILLICLVLALEILNTAIEAVVDLTTGEYHELARIAKDCAAGAVLIMATGSVLVGIAIFGPRLWRLLF
jgi:diacylglycerol kinase (ATP)